MWKFLSRRSESRLVAAVSLCTCVRVSPTPAGVGWAAVHTVSCVQEHPTVIMCTRLCNIYTGVIIGRKTQHCIKILSASLLCTKLLLDIILLNNKFVKYIFFNHMRFLGCAKHVALRLEAQAGEVEAACWVLPAWRGRNTFLQQFFIWLWGIMVDCSCECVSWFLRCVAVGREAAGLCESFAPSLYLKIGESCSVALLDYSTLPTTYTQHCWPLVINLQQFWYFLIQHSHGFIVSFIVNWWWCLSFIFVVFLMKPKIIIPIDIAPCASSFWRWMLHFIQKKCSSTGGHGTHLIISYLKPLSRILTESQGSDSLAQFSLIFTLRKQSS